MKLVIHDLTAEEWEKVKRDYEGDQIISDSGTILPCVGCFGCWNKTPGQCVLRDGYENKEERNRCKIRRMRSFLIRVYPLRDSAQRPDDLIHFFVR